MRVKFGFVSNSSSTSFVCPTCGRSEEGWDWDEHECCGKSMAASPSDLVESNSGFLEYLSKKYNFNLETEKRLFDEVESENPPQKEEK